MASASELVSRLVAELAPDQGQAASDAFGLALELQAAYRPAHSVGGATGGEGEADMLGPVRTLHDLIEAAAIGQAVILPQTVARELLGLVMLQPSSAADAKGVEPTAREVAFGVLWRLVTDDARIHAHRHAFRDTLTPEGKKRGVEWAAANMADVSDAEVRSIEARPQPSQQAGTEGAIDPVIADAMARSIVSFNLTALVAASRALLEACWAADAEEELPEHIDGSLMDAVNDALAALQQGEAG